MILYDISKTCTDVALASILSIVKKILNLVQILGPILLIISMAIIFAKMLANPEEKKYLNNLKNSIIALVLVFFVPILVNVVMKLLDDNINLSKCWNYNEEIMNPTGVTYINVNDRESSSVIVNPGEYEGSKPKQGGNNNGNSNNSSTSSSNTGGRATKITIQYNKKDSGGRCGKGKKDRCVEIATVEYPSKTVKYYMGYQNNSGLLGGSCRSHAFTCGLNATNNTNYSTLDLQNYLYSTGDKGVLKGRARFTKAINHFNAKATAYFEETSIDTSVSLARQALDNGQPVMIFVAGSKCSDLASSHHALLLLGYDKNGKVIFLDSCGRYQSAKKRTLDELGRCMSGNSIAKNWMRMVIFSF